MLTNGTSSARWGDECYNWPLRAISDREKAQHGIRKIDEFVAVALRGFGGHKTLLGTGAYGPELEQCLRRKARSERDQL